MLHFMAPLLLAGLRLDYMGHFFSSDDVKYKLVETWSSFSESIINETVDQQCCMAACLRASKMLSLKYLP